jgi:hypothetical protein
MRRWLLALTRLGYLSLASPNLPRQQVTRLLAATRRLPCRMHTSFWLSTGDGVLNLDARLHAGHLACGGVTRGSVGKGVSSGV